MVQKVWDILYSCLQHLNIKASELAYAKSKKINK
jgi:hypothetical protein